MRLFTAPWCETCKPVKKYIEDKGLKVDIVDIDVNPDSRIRSLPTLIGSDGTITTGTAKIMAVLNG